MMKLRASCCHSGLASPSVDGTPAAAADGFATPGPVSGWSESHPYARAASAHSSVMLPIGFIGRLQRVFQSDGSELPRPCYRARFRLRSQFRRGAERPCDGSVTPVVTAS